MEHDFQERVRAWIAETLATGAEVSFNDVVCALPGVYPNDVAECLDRVRVKLLWKAQKESVGRSKKPLWYLPVPHPLDYDWRFTDESKALVLDRIQEIVSPAGVVALLGAPTLFRAAQETSLGRRCLLIDACPESVATLRVPHAGQVIIADLLRDDVPLSAELVVADPPWYEEFAAVFLWTASRMVQRGGKVLLSTPPVGTRPGIEAEWHRTVTKASEWGLVLRGVEQCLRYQSPPFERNALLAAGHTDVHPEWRPGVLALFEKSRITSDVPRPEVISERAEWDERAVWGVRFRMKRRVSPVIRNPVLVSLTDGDVLPSVSRRDPRRCRADVWTSGNRIFACSDTEALAWILEAVERGNPADTYVESLIGRQLSLSERELVVRGSDQVYRVASRELEEYALNWEG